MTGSNSEAGTHSKNTSSVKFSSLSAPTKIFVGAEREENLIGMIPTRASLRILVLYLLKILCLYNLISMFTRARVCVCAN